MKKKSQTGLIGFSLNVQFGGNAYLLERVAQLEKALARRPRQLQIDLMGRGEIPPDWALLIRSILLQRPARTQLITNARSSLQDGSVLVWLMGDRRMIRDDARVFFRRVDMSKANVPDEPIGKENDPDFVDSFSEIDPEDGDYVQMLWRINEFLPVKELAGKNIQVPVLRQFGLVETEKLDRFLASAFGQGPSAGVHPSSEPQPKRRRANVKATPTK